jgi:hypothetical protein
MLLLCVAAVILAAAGTVLLILALAYRRLGYTLTDSALCIDWLGRTDVVPYHAVQGIYTGQRLGGHATPKVPNWPGVRVGPARVRGLGRLRFFATSADQTMLTLVTVPHGGVVLSARDPQEFRAALIERVEDSQDAVVDANALAWHQRPPDAAPWTALADAWLPTCAIAATLLLLLVLAAIVFQFDSLPDQIAVHFDASGRPNDVAPKSDLLRLPLLGLTVLVVNWVLGLWLHPRERLLARLLWIGGAIVQVVLLMGVLRLVTS